MQDRAAGDAVLLLGTDEPIPPVQALRAGPLSVDIRGVHLHRIRAWGHEVWHGAAFLYRDPDWLTPEPVVVSQTLTQERDSFHLVLRGVIEAAAVIDFVITIEGFRSGRIRYEAEAVPRADLATNRCGVVAMHPLTCAGRPVVIEHTDARVSHATIPESIAPWPPFTLIRAIRHEVVPGVQASCRFGGDAFEFEDQRNNADASFKTYNRSNQAPRPYRLRAGGIVRQSVDLSIQGWPEGQSAPSGDDETQRARGKGRGAHGGGGEALHASHELRAAPPALPVLSVHAEAPGNALPALGVGLLPADAASAGAAGTALADAAASTSGTDLAALCARLSPDTLHLCLPSPEEPVDWAGVARLMKAGASGLRIDLEGLEDARDEPRLHALADRIRQAGIRPESVALLSPTPGLADAARRAFPGVLIGGGTPHFFVQLNRMDVPEGLDFLSFTTSSVVHGTDEQSIMAGLGSAPGMTATLSARHGPLPVRMGPSRIGARRSPLGRQPDSDGSRRLTLARRDPRDSALFGAAWALGHYAAFAQAEADAITLFWLQGDGGLCDIGGQEPVIHPAFHVLASLAGGGLRRQITGGDPSRVAALAAEREGVCQWWLANLHAEPVEVSIASGSPVAGVHLLDLEGLRQQDSASPWRDLPVHGDTLRLPAYATALVRLAGRW